jgi:hypothetical protein
MGAMTEQTPSEAEAEAEAEMQRRRRLLDDVDLVPEQTGDDIDDGWSTGSPAPGDGAATLRRYLDEKPPHHGD